MNSFISAVFGILLNIMHFFAVISCLGIMLYGSDNYLISSYGNPFLVGLGSLFVYALVVGFITTIITINDRLGKIISLLES